MFSFHQSALKFGFPSAHQNVKHQRQACLGDYLGEFGSPASNNDQSFCMSWLSGMFSQSAAPHFKCWRLKMCLLATLLIIDTPVTHMFIATRPLWLRNFRHFLLCFFSVCIQPPWIPEEFSSHLSIFLCSILPAMMWLTQYLHPAPDSITLVTLIYALRFLLSKFCAISKSPSSRPPDTPSLGCIYTDFKTLSSLGM